MPTPARAEGPAYQDVGEQLSADGFAGVLFLSAARPVGRGLCILRPGRALPGRPRTAPVSLAEAIERPTTLAFDLDPGTRPAWWSAARRRGAA